MNSHFIVYCVLLSDDSVHSGITKNLIQRIALHNNATEPNLPTFGKTPVRLIYQEAFTAVLPAKKRLSELQELTKEAVLELPITPLLTVVEPDELQKHSPSAISLPICYHPPIAYFAELVKHHSVVFDGAERFEKQTYRSRCSILGANGVLDLTIPVTRPNGKETRVKDVLISRAENWEINHIRAISSAYSKTPFYDFYADELFEIIQFPFDRLISLNLKLTAFYCKKLGIKTVLNFEKAHPSSIPHKNMCLPKNRNIYLTKPYIQAFSNKFNFESNLSILDLLFCEGPNALNILTEKN